MTNDYDGRTIDTASKSCCTYDNLKEMILVPDDPMSHISALIQEIGEIELANSDALTALDRQVQALQAQFHDEQEPRLRRLNEAATEVLAWITVHFDDLPWEGQTLRFPTGQVAIRKSPTSIELDDSEDVVIARIRARGWLRLMTRQPKRVLDKRAMAKLPDLVAQLRGVRIVQKVNMIITPGSTKIDVSVRANALRQLVSKS